jgi:hypothetical protein
MVWPQNEPLKLSVPLPVLSLADAVIFKSVVQLEEPTVRPPVTDTLTEVVVPLSDPLKENVMLGSLLKVTPPSLQLLIVSTRFADSELEVSE